MAPKKIEFPESIEKFRVKRSIGKMKLQEVLASFEGLTTEQEYLDALVAHYDVKKFVDEVVAPVEALVVDEPTEAEVFDENLAAANTPITDGSDVPELSRDELKELDKKVGKCVGFHPITGEKVYR